MRCKPLLSVGLMLALPIFFAQFRMQADGPFSWLHPHGCCPAEQDTVTIPGRQIRIVTAKPQIIVSDGSIAPRGRAYYPAAGPFMPYSGAAFMPMMGGPLVATIMPMSGAPCGMTPSTCSSALDAAHAMERQQMEFAKQRAALQKEMEYVDQAFKRASAGLPAAAPPPSDAAKIQQCLTDLTNRVSAIEKLLIIHDSAIKAANPSK